LAPYVGRICGAIALEAGEDAAQETLIAVFRRLRSLKEPDALWGWVRTIAVREAVRIARSPARAGAVAAGAVPVRGPDDPEIAGEWRRVFVAQPVSWTPGPLDEAPADPRRTEIEYEPRAAIGPIVGYPLMQPR